MKNLLLIFVLSLLTACTNYTFEHEPGSNKNPLIVGKVTLLVTKSDIAQLPADTYTWGMTINVRNTATGEMSSIPVESNQGYFQTYDLAPGSYQIKKITFSTATSSIWIDPSKREKFTISNDGVNNLGDLYWTSNITDSERTASFFAGHSAVKAFFAEQNKNSNWMKATWIDIKRDPL